MKSIINNIFFLIIGLLIAGCSDSDERESSFAKGTGGLNLTVPETEKEIDIPVIYTKAGDLNFNLQPEIFPISVYEKDGGAKVKDFESFTALIDSGTPLVLPVGAYEIKASSFNPTESVSEKPYFEGTTNFEIEEGVVLNTSVICTFKSLGVELRLSERFQELLSQEPDNYDYNVTVSNEKGSWSFDKKNMKSGYFLDGCSRLTVKVVVKMKGQTYPERTWHFTNGENAPKVGEYYIVTLDAGKSELRMSSCKF